jgi:hypothetical protein
MVAAVEGRGSTAAGSAPDRTLPILRTLLVLWLAGTGAGCAATRPTQLNDVCAIFSEKPAWYEEAHDSYVKWGVPIPLQLAVIHQESHFESDVRPPRDTFLWIFPGSRPSSAYGYGQVLESTWDQYQESSGGMFADRDDFGDVADFIGWYGAVGERRFGIPKTDPYAFYLSYHEGHAGYVRGTYKRKRELQAIAAEVARRARRYERQLDSCESSLRAGRGGGGRFG